MWQSAGWQGSIGDKRRRDIKAAHTVTQEEEGNNRSQHYRDTLGTLQIKRTMPQHLLGLLEEDETLAPRREVMRQIRNRAHQVLSAGWADRERVSPKLLIAIRHAFDSGPGCR
jgi:hypothetical protein